MNIVNDKIIVPAHTLLSDSAMIPQKIAFRENTTAKHIQFFAVLNGSVFLLTEDDKLIDLNIDRNGTTS